jgi:hypothetical protein
MCGKIRPRVPVIEPQLLTGFEESATRQGPALLLFSIRQIGVIAKPSALRSPYCASSEFRKKRFLLPIQRLTPPKKIKLVSGTGSRRQTDRPL